MDLDVPDCGDDYDLGPAQKVEEGVFEPRGALFDVDYVEGEHPGHDQVVDELR